MALFAQLSNVFEKSLGMTKIDEHFLLFCVVICFTIFTREIARNLSLYFLECKFTYTSHIYWNLNVSLHIIRLTWPFW